MKRKCLHKVVACIMLATTIAPTLGAQDVAGVGYASGLVPEQCSVGERPLYYPIEEIYFTFDGAIDVVDGSTASIYSEGQVVASGVVSCSNYVGKKRTQGCAIFNFDEPLILPKGMAYKFVVPENVIFIEGRPDISNDELTVDFAVPADLGEADPSIEEGSVVVNEDRIGFYFRYETAPIEGKKAILLREGIPVREYECEVSWDWNLGYAGINFGKYMNFEAGVKYTVTLPEGSVSTLYRPDIINKEASVSFIGGYTKPVKPVHYVWCSIFNNHLTDVIGVVKFYYDQPVALSPNPKVLLYNEDEKVIAKEAVPTLTQEEGRYVMVVDFENTPLVSGVGYTLVIPEGTLVTENGDVLVNSRNALPLVGSSTDIAGTDGYDCSINVMDGVVSVDNLPQGSEVMLFALDGKTVYKARTDAGKVSIPVPACGLYLLSINGKTHKVEVR